MVRDLYIRTKYNEPGESTESKSNASFIHDVKKAVLFLLVEDLDFRTQVKELLRTIEPSKSSSSEDSELISGELSVHPKKDEPLGGASDLSFPLEIRKRE